MDGAEQVARQWNGMFMAEQVGAACPADDQGATAKQRVGDLVVFGVSGKADVLGGVAGGGQDADG